MIQRVPYFQPSHSGGRSAHSALCAQLEKAHLSNELLSHNIHKSWDEGNEIFTEMQTTPEKSFFFFFFLNPTVPFWKGAGNVNHAIVWLFRKLALWESKIEQIYANNRLREITCKQQRQPGQQFRPSLVKKIFPSVTKSISYTSANPW